MTKFSYSLFTYYLKSGWPKFPDFDRVYTNDMVNDHQKVAAGHQKEQGQVKDPQLMTYLDNTLTGRAKPSSYGEGNQEHYHKPLT